MSLNQKKSVLFLCTHNSCRSQMAEGLLRHLYGSTFESSSAGIIQSSVHPLAIKVMDEIDIDILNQSSKTIQVYSGQVFDYVVTVCDNAKEQCPFFPGKEILHQSFPDPSSIQGSYDEQLQAFRETRDMIKQWIEVMFSKVR